MRYSRFIGAGTVVMALSSPALTRAECTPYGPITLAQNNRCTSGQLNNRPALALQTRVCPSTLWQSGTAVGWCYAGATGALTTIITVFCQPPPSASEPQNLDQIEISNSSFWCWDTVARQGTAQVEGIMVYSKK